MKTSLTEVQQIEHWLQQEGDPSERLVTEVQLLLNPQLREKVEWQVRTYRLVQLYGRQKLREEIKAVEHRLFTATKHKTFQERIRTIFKY
ncbi:hypothetical protein R9C00_15570 [Flammeovirgaceae bacterium SG7u.111]|nr:hypothetical protein [Flammeovirgaceae bacterium SG7u.132]WPO33121.1 hypothetical protein R9C00_15570 [Flammeovirgaceae bacterium SG7u.111]